jgi:hypothetical protein
VGWLLFVQEQIKVIVVNPHFVSTQTKIRKFKYKILTNRHRRFCTVGCTRCTVGYVRCAVKLRVALTFFFCYNRDNPGRAERNPGLAG